MLCGIPTSGKSTYVKKLKNMDYWSNAVILSTDNYIEAEATKLGKTYNETYSTAIVAASRQLKLDLAQAIGDNKDIIWDQTNLTTKSRRKKLKSIPDYYRKGAVYFEISLEEALIRNKARGSKLIPESTIVEMLEMFQHPTTYEGFNYATKG